MSLAAARPATIRLPRILDAPKEVVGTNPAHTGEATLKHN